MFNSGLGGLIIAVSSCRCWGGCSFNKPQTTGWEPAGSGDGHQSEKHCHFKESTDHQGVFQANSGLKFGLLLLVQKNKDAYVRSVETLTS